MFHTRVIKLSTVLLLLASTCWAAGEIARTDLARMRVSRQSRGSTGTPALTVKAYYRPSVTTGITDEKEMTLDSDSQEEVARFKDLELTALYYDSAYEGRSLVIRVGRRDTGATIVQHLYQMDRQKQPANQFQGQHGFSGLVYTYHPESGAEMQFILESR